MVEIISRLEGKRKKDYNERNHDKKGSTMERDTQTIIREHFNDEVRYRERKRLLFFGLPWTFTVYTMTDSVLTVDTGLLNTEQNDCYMYKIQDVKLNQSLLEKLFGIATITCYTGDVSDSVIMLTHIRHYQEIKSFLLKASEAARIRRRTMNVQDIGAHGMADADSLADSF